MIPFLWVFIFHGVEDSVAWDSGATKWWDLLLTYLVIGTILNGIQLCLHVSIPELMKQPVGPIVLWLAMEDFLFDFICTIQCALNRQHHEFFGHETGCRLQAFYGSFLMLMSCATIVSLMYACYSAVVHGKYPSMKTITRIHIGLGVYCLFVTILGNFWPGQHHLVPSGIYCYANLGTRTTALIFHFMFFGPVFCILFYLYWKIFRGIQKMNDLLAIQQLGHLRARPSQLRVVKIMSVYIVGVGLCFSLIEAGGVYMWITNLDGPPGLFFAGGFMGHFLTFISPILYYIVFVPARDVVRSKICGGRHIDSDVLYKRGTLLMVLNDMAWNTEFTAFSQQRLCSENLMFWHAVQEWKELVRGFLVLNSSSSSSPSPSVQRNNRRLHSRSASDLDVSSQHTLDLSGQQHSLTILQKDDPMVDHMLPRDTIVNPRSLPAVAVTRISEVELEPPPAAAVHRQEIKSQSATPESIVGAACQIYTLYIAKHPEPAPWQINISSENETQLSHVLHIRYNEEKHAYECDPHWDITQQTLCMFNEVEEEIMGLIQHDIYKRFVDSQSVSSRLTTFLQTKMRDSHSLEMTFSPTSHSPYNLASRPSTPDGETDWDVR